ncbi:hypothetical protein PG996_012075 [Apiospora saccharicola]|uniref:Uncharacterized protein n=1 Tax=Apiospora saccharicola TaxID=335842 RepID=A0ABR1U4A3_9PEZI
MTSLEHPKVTSAVSGPKLGNNTAPSTWKSTIVCNLIWGSLFLYGINIGGADAPDEIKYPV